MQIDQPGPPLDPRKAAVTARLRSKLPMALVYVVIIGAALFFRIWAYGDFRQSVGHRDTVSYINSSRAPLFSWKMFAGQRLLTTNLLYKVANDEHECPLTVLSRPADGAEAARSIQPCFDKIALVQNVLAVIAWSLAAWLLSRHLREPLLKVLCAVLILAFGFTPQIAEWDFTLGAESLTLSLFVITFAVLHEIAFRFAAEPGRAPTRSTQALIAIWIVLFFLWVFVRDVHLYAVPISFVLIAILLINPARRKEKAIAALLIILALMFVLGSKSAQDSLRATHYPLLHAFEAHIFPYESRIKYMQSLGMPDLNSPEWEGWFDANATRVYALFLLTHREFVLYTLWDDSFYLSLDYLQPYYVTDDIPARDSLLRIGEFLHPHSLSIYLVDLLLLLGFYVHALRQRRHQFIAWAWLATWYLLCAAVTLFPTFFGDTLGTPRHVFPSVEMFRLFLWVFLFVYLDRLGESDAPSPPEVAAA